MAYNRQIPGNKNYTFAQVPQVGVPRSKFNRSSNLKTTFQAGTLTPIFLDEVLPGDTLSLRMDSLVRSNTPIRPTMDNIYINTFWFFVPCRLLWDNWERFMGAQDNPNDPINFTMPKVTGTNVIEGSLWDYFGLPTRVTNTLTVNSMPFRAYNLIINDWFKSQDIVNNRPENRGNGPDNLADYVLQRRMKRADYFTRALPWPQKGGVSVPLPLGTSAPVYSIGAGTLSPTPITYLRDGAPTETFTTEGFFNTLTIRKQGATFTNTGAISLPLNSGVIADLSSATAATINQLREAFQIQRLLERDARSGTRYQESILAHFKVASKDARLARPEVLNVGQTTLMINPVADTTRSTVVAEGNLGELGAYGVASINKHGFTYSATEHGYVIGLINVRADMTYWQGIEKLWTRDRRYDFYFPVLSHLGEQPVLSREIFADGTAGDNTTFGFQERWAEYRYKPSQLTGLMRPNATPVNLADWHLAQNFATRPTLNLTFMQENPPMTRIFNSLPTGYPDFWADIHYTYLCARPMPVYSVPGYIDHF